MDTEEMSILTIDEEYAPIITVDEAKTMQPIQKRFMESYLAHRDNMTVAEWLPTEMAAALPDRSEQDIRQMSMDILSTLELQEEKKASLEAAVAKGRSKESWFASTILQSTSQMSAQESAKYLQGLDDAVRNANAAMHETITTKGSGYVVPSMNPNLDGFIAEQYHVNSFNMNAAAKGSGLRAEVQPLKPGETYTKNGFDVIIKDASGKRIHQYQMKYGATAEDTIRMIRSGNYNNQTIVVPEEQVAAVQAAFPTKTVTSTIGDGNVQSNPLTKKDAKRLQEQAQDGDFVDADWNDYAAKDIAIGIGKQVGQAALMGAAIGVGFDVAQKVWNGEKINGEELVETALVSGADFGIKAAAAGAIKACVEKDLISVIPKGTPASTITSVVQVAVENVKVIYKMAKGELSAKEGLDKMEQVTVSTVAGIAASAKGAAIGSTIGSVLGPIGTAVGGFIGGTVGYMAGSKVGQLVIKGAQKIRDGAVHVIKTVGRAVKNSVQRVSDGIRNFFGRRKLFG